MITCSLRNHVNELGEKLEFELDGGKYSDIQYILGVSAGYRERFFGKLSRSNEPCLGCKKQGRLAGL